jgi:hypothetical protein
VATLSDEVVKVAVPPESVPLPIWVPLSLNATVPVGVPEGIPSTCAVKVTDWPKTLGLAEETSVVAVVVSAKAAVGAKTPVPANTALATSANGRQCVAASLGQCQRSSTSRPQTLASRSWFEH